MFTRVGVHRQDDQEHTGRRVYEGSETCLCLRHPEAYFNQCANEVVDDILKHEYGGGCEFVGRPGASIVSVDGYRDAAWVAMSRQRKDAG